MQISGFQWLSFSAMAEFSGEGRMHLCQTLIYWYQYAGNFRQTAALCCDPR